MEINLAWESAALEIERMVNGGPESGRRKAEERSQKGRGRLQNSIRKAEESLQKENAIRKAEALKN